jgi:hypothetical protein
VSDEPELERKLVRLAAAAAVRDGARPLPAPSGADLEALLDEIDAVVLPRTLRFDGGGAPLFCEVAGRRVLRAYLGKQRPAEPLDVSDGAAAAVRAVFESFLKGASDVIVTTVPLSGEGLGAEIGISAGALRSAWDLPGPDESEPADRIAALIAANEEGLLSWHLSGPDGDSSGGNADDSTALGLLGQRAEKELMDAPGPHSAGGDPAVLVMLSDLQGQKTLLAGRLGPVRVMMRVEDAEAAQRIASDWQMRMLR